MLGSPTKTRNKKNRQGLPIASLMPKSVLSNGREDQLLRESIFVRTFHRWGGLVFIMDDHEKFPSLMMIRNDTFPCWMMIRIFLPLDKGFSFHIVNELIRDN